VEGAADVAGDAYNRKREGGRGEKLQ
jgi:hypothetical protein